VARIGDLVKPFEQTGQLAAQDAQLSGHRLLTRLLFLGQGGVGRAGIGQCLRLAAGLEALSLGVFFYAVAL